MWFATQSAMPQRSKFAHPFPETLSAGRTARLRAVEASFLFADVVESTALAERLGERAAYSVIRRFCVLLRDTALDLGGEALELRGDGAVLVFATAGAALDAARRIQYVCASEGEISLRIGVHRGAALRLERGYFGRALVLAARLADHAAPGEILASAEAIENLGADHSFRLRAQRSLNLKGFPEPVRARAIEWRRSYAAREGGERQPA